MWEKFFTFLGLCILIPLIAVFVFFVGIYVLAAIGLMLLIMLVVVLADMPVKVTMDDKQVGTWRRSTGFVPDKKE
jgi:hypothetical protein